MALPIKRFLPPVLLAASLSLNFGCSHFQATKDVWKGTKELWYEYMSPPASIDYSDVSTLTPTAQALVNGMMGIDKELTKLERLMNNADRTPSRSWAEQFFVTVPWVDGFAGVRADGSLLGNIPAPGKTPLTVDWIPLLYEPEKQSSRDLRADVQPGANGPEILVAATMYDGVDFLGVVASYFSMNQLMDRVKNPDDVVILTPYALLWSKYEYGATPMAGINWVEAVTKSASGTVSNETGKFVYQVRWLANLPVIFCVVEDGAFPKGSGSLAGTEKYFPAREKKPVPPLKERSKNLLQSGSDEFMAPKPGEEAHGAGGDIEPGSNRSMLLQPGAQQQNSGRVRERDLGSEGTYQPKPKPRAQRRRMPIVIPDMEPAETTPPPTIERPSPFGPKKTEAQPAEGAEAKAPVQQPAEAGNAAEAPKEAPAGAAKEAPKDAGADTEKKPAPNALDMDVDPVAPTLSGGRLSPFGPRGGAAQEKKPEAAEQKAPEAAPEAAKDAAPKDAAPAAGTDAPEK